MSMGISSAAPQPVVVKIPEDRLHHVVEYFISVKGLYVENAHAISRSKIWYGIVEGAHRRKALINLGEKVPIRFKGYPWVVLCIDWQPLDILRAFARERNEFQRGEHLVDFTMYDIFKNLKQSAEEVALREGLIEGRGTNRGYLKRVADHYCGGSNTANNLTRQLAGIAVVLSWPMIDEMGVLLNKEDPSRSRSIAQEKGDVCIDFVDGRVCKNLFTKSTFRGATTFKSVATDEDRISTLRRISFLAPGRDYKPITKTELEVQTKKSMAARMEVEKMAKKLGTHDWPTDLRAVREKLLSTPDLDFEVEEHAGSNDLIPTFKELWERLFPMASELERATNDVVEVAPEPEKLSNQNSDLDAVRNLEFPPGDVLEDKGQDDSGYEASDNDSGIVLSDGEGSADDMETVKLCPLEQLGIRVDNKGWRQFQMTLVSEDLFDFIFADSIQSLSSQQLKESMWTEFKDERKIKEFAAFCRNSLRPGCYVFVIVLAQEVAAFSSAFQAEGMKLMKTPFFLIPKAESFRDTRLKDLPQGCGELAVVARAPGSRSSFKMDLPYSLVECTFKRKVGIIDNVPRCQNPLHAAKSKTEVRPRERHPDFISEVIETFCTPKGTVLDVFGGALTSAISCLLSSRPCVVIEEDRYCYDLAVSRLETLCRDKVISQEVECRMLAES